MIYNPNDLKKFLIILMVCLIPLAVDSQIKSKNYPETAVGQMDNDEGLEDRIVTRTLKDEQLVNPNSKTREVEEDTFRSVEQMPRFSGGEAALMKYLQAHINYPPKAAEHDIEGRVIVQFVVKKDGRIGEVKVVRSVNPELDAEAVRICRSLPSPTSTGAYRYLAVL